MSEADNESQSDSESEVKGVSVMVQVEMDMRTAREEIATRMKATRAYTTKKRRNTQQAAEGQRDGGEKVYKGRKVIRDESRLAKAALEEQRLPRLKEAKKLTKLAVFA